MSLAASEPDSPRAHACERDTSCRTATPALSCHAHHHHHHTPSCLKPQPCTASGLRCYVRSYLRRSTPYGGQRAVNVAVALATRLGLRVGLLDADIHGPSIPTLMNVRGKPAVDQHGGANASECGSQVFRILHHKKGWSCAHPASFGSEIRVAWLTLNGAGQ